MVRSILVTGATGKQGSAVIKALVELAADFEIIALTREPSKKSAQALLKLSPRIRLITGDLNNPREIFQKVRVSFESSIWGVFSVQPIYIGPGADKHLEERQGKALIDTALENDVEHFVYTSVDRGGARSDYDSTKIPHFISKHNIERHLIDRAKESRMTWTILRPVAFFENLTPDFMGKVFATNLKRTLKNNKKLQLIATSDIGYVAALSFIRPEDFKSKKLSLAGDELSYIQLKTIFQDLTGQKLPTTLRIITSLLNWAFGEMGCMFKWFQFNGYGADITSVRKLNPNLKDFSTWMKEESFFETLHIPVYEASKESTIILLK